MFNDYTVRWFDVLVALADRNDKHHDADLPIHPIREIAGRCPNQRNTRTLYAAVAELHRSVEGNADEATAVMGLLGHIGEVQAHKFSTGKQKEFRRAFSHTLRGVKSMTDVSAASSLFSLVNQAVFYHRQAAVLAP